MIRPGQRAEHVSLFLGSALCMLAAGAFLGSVPSLGSLFTGSLLSLWALSSLAALVAVAGTGIVFLKARLP